MLIGRESVLAAGIDKARVLCHNERIWWDNFHCSNLTDRRIRIVQIAHLSSALFARLNRKDKYREYDKKLYECKTDDVWVSVETPLKEKK